MAAMEIILDSQKISQIINTLVDQIAKSVSDSSQNPPAIIGIRSRGEILGQRLAKLLVQRLGCEVPCGVLDITLYRDDLNKAGGAFAEVRSTEIGFDINDKLLILVDDVLYTGRSTRAAMDALIDLGRPKAIRLAVLVERDGREFPIQADFAGHKIKLPPDKNVEVNFIESDGIDRVIVR